MWPFKSKALVALRSQVSALQRQLILTPFERINSSIAYYPDWKSFDNADRYCTTDDIYSIVRMLSTTAALVPLWCYKVKADKVLKQLKSLRHDAEPRLHKALLLKALEDLPDTDPVQMLLDNPNMKCGKYEFFECLFSSLFIQGEGFIYKQRAVYGVNGSSDQGVENPPNDGKPVQLHVLFPQFVVMKITTSYPHEVVGYDYIVDGIKLIENIPPEDIIHIKYYNPKFSIHGNELRGLSPLKVLAKRLSRLDSEMNISVSQLQNGGVPTIVWDKTASGDPEASVEIVGQRKDNFYRFLNNSQGAPFFASGEMGSIQTGLKLADLEVADLAKIDFKKLCNVYGVSDILFNNDTASTESNVKEMTKRLYTNAVLPNIFRVRDALILGLLPDFKDKKRFIQADISEIPELQENYKDLAQWLSTSYWITPNEKREMMKFDRLEDPVFDSPVLPSGLMTLEDLTSIPDIEQVTDGN